MQLAIASASGAPNTFLPTLQHFVPVTAGASAAVPPTVSTSFGARPASVPKFALGLIALIYLLGLGVSSGGCDFTPLPPFVYTQAQTE